MSIRATIRTAALVAAGLACAAEPPLPYLEMNAVQTTADRLIERHGEARAERIRRGVLEVARRWWEQDGNAEEFSRFCLDSFLADDGELDAAFARLERVMEQIDGHLLEVRRELLSPQQLDTGPVMTVDRLLGDVDPATHVDEDLFGARVAFLALLNFPVHTLEQRLAQGAGWDRATWARSRMMDRFALRVPATVSAGISRALTAADRYVAGYNIHTGRLISADGRPLFDRDRKLITHWGLRDELKSWYGQPGGLERQRAIAQVLRRIVRQEIPTAVIDNPDVAWSPATNELRAAQPDGPRPADGREPDTRYARLLDVFHAVRAADPYSPAAPTFIDRRFELDRQIPEGEVRALLESVLVSPEFAATARLIRERLQRPLEAFDIWYDGFKPRGALAEAELDRIVGERYPGVDAFRADLPRILGVLGFSAERAAWLAGRIVVDPSRGAGHALGAERREDRAHLRTRVGERGMDYKGYNIAVHELGHNVEQVFSLERIDHWWLHGVPNNAFTEALAFVFQNRDLELLGLAAPSPETRRLAALDTLWGAAEIGGVALVDMAVWRWMYEHPEATPAELREATLACAREVWNRFFAPVLGVTDSEILAVYSHMIVYGLYLPDYSLGMIIAHQIEDRLRRGELGAGFERMARQGRLTPDAWMRGAVGGPISAAALLASARRALGAENRPATETGTADSP